MAAIGQPPGGPINATVIVHFPLWRTQALKADRPAHKVLRELPSFKWFNPPLSSRDLHDALEDPFNALWDSRTPAAWLGKYQRVASGTLDDMTPGDTPTHNFTMDSLKNCHDGLLRLRTGHSYIQLPDESELCQFAFRLLSWSQKRPAARMGGFKSAGRAWWLAAAPFTLAEPTSAGNTPVTIFNLDLAGAVASVAKAYSHQIPVGEETKAGFEAAIFSLHPVHLKNSHFSLIILHKPPPDPALPAANQAAWRYWYLDSQKCCYEDDVQTGKTAAEWRSNRANIAAELLTQFLKNSGVNIPGGVLQPAADVVMTPQLEPYTCGLHVVANIIAFIRFERIGWDRVNDWRIVGDPTDRTKRMESSLIMSLHHIMGLKLGRNGSNLDKYQTGLYAPKEGEPDVFRISNDYGPEKGERKQVAQPAKTPRGNDQSDAQEAGDGIKRDREEDGGNEEEPQAKRARGDEEGGGGIKRGREYDGDGEELPAKRARGDEERQASNTAEGAAAAQETEGCRCANPRREQGVESAEVREAEPGDLAVRAWDRDVPLARPARGRLADLNWQTMRTIRFRRAISGDNSQNVRRECEGWVNPDDMDASIIEETVPSSVEEAINTTVGPVDDAEEVFQDPADAPYVPSPRYVEPARGQGRTRAQERL
ncbi:hypothetical protein QBC43DRAFT_353235 [Cladorrhinum sp. PSN259]|nr:hypothetical protein QBC43DRAFT_353235 [Cladorrhinum sp. PSN259]